jgi:hypothetical protein
MIDTVKIYATARCSFRAAVQTSRAASAFIEAMPSPITKSGHADGHTNAVTRPTAMMATFARASLRAERKACSRQAAAVRPVTGQHKGTG